MTSQPWPGKLPVRNVRIARPTDQLDAVLRFYRDGLGLPELDRFAGHAGYEGVLLGLPGHLPVQAENPYWTEHGAVTVEDPDHWRVVLVPQPQT